MNDQLIPVFNGTISNEPSLLCNARDLHTFLEVGKNFSNWIVDRISEYELAANLDYIVFTPNLVKTPGRPKKDYHLTLDTAKELAMVERNEKGRQIRRYFIECEKELRQVKTTSTEQRLPVSPSPAPESPRHELLPTGIYTTTSKYNPYRAYAREENTWAYVGCFPTVDEAVAAQKRFLEDGAVKRIWKKYTNAPVTGTFPAPKNTRATTTGTVQRYVTVPATTSTVVSPPPPPRADESGITPEDFIDHLYNFMETAQILGRYRWGKELAWSLRTFVQEEAARRSRQRS